MHEGMPGYRLRLPVKVHPISAGIKGGILGGLIMPIPAAIYGVLSGDGIWMPLNLLSGMVLPSIGNMSDEQLKQFSPTLFVLGICIHATVSLILGLMYGVLMPALPAIPKPIAWGALLMPLLWTAASFLSLSIVNPAVRREVDWPWFIVSQFIFGLVAAIVFMQDSRRHPIRAGLLGGIAGGLTMPIPALLWGLLSKHGIWYPANLLAAMADRSSEPTVLQTRAVSCGVVDPGGDHARGALDLLWSRLWSGAAQGAGDSGPAGVGWFDDAALVDRQQLRPDGRGQSGAAKPDRLAVVHRLAIRL